MDRFSHQLPKLFSVTGSNDDGMKQMVTTRREPRFADKSACFQCIFVIMEKIDDDIDDFPRKPAICHRGRRSLDGLVTVKS